ncbi:hypothetical protein AVEN_119953-1 [Araneus ventricosus]|uniref:Major facilitator superfamily (MFS) profile domain-containing protein n=1 Tax=Araneus ventricosus TaxID=182803 RepID=A0A4Y2ICG8_ARAVE|nr:hypothetical protein AVEN_119953-1 [Araneus ventricosus]
MAKDDPNKDVDTRRKVYDISAFEDLDYSPVFVNPAWRDINHSNAKERTNSSCSIFQCRYVVTLFGIFVYFELDSYRINTSMSLVKMVNRTLINAKKNFNNTVDSCPFNNSAIQELPYPVVGGEFNWSPEIQGYILSAGFLGYVVSQIPGGMLAETYGGKVTLFSGLLLSSLAHMLCPFAAWFNGYLMIAMQFLRGVGQVRVLVSFCSKIVLNRQQWEFADN